ncbi:MAG: putative rane protein [Clostridiaceae bacterium]|jgi:uncharacterized membrane protein YhhN|nr:putative rane protein [Clostridiaceae bacterium]
MNIKIYPFILFLLLSLLNIISIKKHNKSIRIITKPLLMPTLLLAYLYNASCPSNFIVFALIFGFLGDTFLLGDGIFFTAGLISFLLGHIFYITALLTPISLSKIPFYIYIVILPYLIYGFIVYNKLSPFLKSIKLQGLLYFIVLITMSFTSLLRIYNVHGYQFWFPFIGSILFVMSDTMLAFNEFKSKTAVSEISIMLTYLAAQLLIVLGFIN